MKTILLSKYVEEDKHYTVYLGNGTVSKFTNLKAAKKFLATTGEELTRIWSELWDIQTQQSAYFHEYFKLLLVSTKGGNGNLLQYERNLIENLSAATGHFNQAIWRAKWENGNYFAFQHLHRILLLQLENTKMLAQIAAQKNFHHHVGSFDIQAERIITAKSKLENYNLAKAHSLFDVPRHFDFTTLLEQMGEKHFYKPTLKIVA